MVGHGCITATGRRALQLEWEEPFSATYNTYKMPPTLSLRQYETQNITKESALMHHIFCLHLKCKQCDPLQVLLRQDCRPATLLDALPTHSVVYISCTSIQCAIVCVQQYASATPVCILKMQCNNLVFWRTSVQLLMNSCNGVLPCLTHNQ